MPPIVCDVHEQRSGIPEFLGEFGVDVELRALERGDYLLGVDTVVERKSVADLHASIVSGRFWAQIGKIRAFRWPWLIIEGTSPLRGQVSPDAIRGACLRVATLGVAIIRTEDTDDTARWLVRMAALRDGVPRDRPVYAQRPRSNQASPAETAIAAAPGVSIHTARTVLEAFGSLERLCGATIEGLRTLDGVGPERAKSIYALLHQPRGQARSN